MPIGYHFTANTLRDGAPVPPIGEKIVFNGEIEICRSGLHWSEHPSDALEYAPGRWLHLVECSEPVESESDKHVSRERTILKTIDAEYLCRRFAADQALSIAHLWDMPKIIRNYLTTLDESKRAAARAATRGAAREAAGETTGADAWETTGADAWEAAWIATRESAWLAAREATRAARGGAGDARDTFKASVDAAFDALPTDTDKDDQ